MSMDFGCDLLSGGTVWGGADVMGAVDPYIVITCW